jgi:hypothetical protein
MPDVPEDRAEHDARVINLDEYRAQEEPMKAPSSSHPAHRALRKKEEEGK